MESFTCIVFSTIPLYGIKFKCFKRFKYRGSWKNETFISHAILYWRTRQMAHDQCTALSNRIREYQVIFFPFWMYRFMMGDSLISHIPLKVILVMELKFL